MTQTTPTTYTHAHTLDAYSVNHLKTWRQCPKKFELALERRLNWPSDPKNFRLGKGVHQLLDYRASGLAIEAIVAASDADIALGYQRLAESPWGQANVVASEWGFSLCLPDEDGSHSRWIYGRVDRIVRHPTDPKQVVILDWKTGTRIPQQIETDWQTRIYLLAVYLSRHDLGLAGLELEQLAMTYVKFNPHTEGTPENEAVLPIETATVPYTDALHADTLTRLTDSFRAIDHARLSGHYALPRRCPDRHCPYRHVCGIQAQPQAGPPMESDTQNRYTEDLLPF
ncbi:MAG: PD-(D/E)XK nuclease family protein [Vampirovibrionales bacterium]|nr:PD-(D/E)XK nuclease family protein [Cyanobacteria bacterium HKST-UBA03]